MNTLVRDAMIAGAGLAVGVGATLGGVFLRNRKGISKAERLRKKAEKLNNQAAELREQAQQAEKE